MSFAARTLLLVALTFSSMLAVDYLGSSPRYCGEAGGCGAVRISGYGALFGVPLPLWGLAGLGVLLALSLVRRRWAQLLTRLGAAFGVAVGLGLLYLQVFVIDAVCSFCAVVDVAALLAGALLLAGPRPEAGPERLALHPLAWLALGALAIAAPLVYPRVAAPPPLPPGIEALQVPGKLTVVEFADFECPFCRNLHPRLAALIAAQPAGSVHVVRRNVPLPFHRYARGAALGHLCAEAQGKGEAMADLLFRARSLRPESIREAAGTLGLDLAAYDACLTSPETAADLEEQIALFASTGHRGLPTAYIGARVLSGARSDEEIAQLFTEAEEPSGIPGPGYLAIALALAALVLGLGRARRSRDAATAAGA